MAKKESKVKKEEEAPKEEPTPESKPEATEDYKIINTANGPMKRYYADNRLEKI
tara:strand:- start:86 stop:247 length:162 start_codon:yes stop_codon:yes gene_type:complete